MEEIRWIETPNCRSCVPRPEYRRRFACLGCERLRPKPPAGKKPACRPPKPARRHPPEQKGTILAMRERGCSYGRIAAALSLPRSTVQGIIFRARCTRREKSPSSDRINIDG